MQVKCIIDALLPFTGFETPLQMWDEDVQRKLFPERLTKEVTCQVMQETRLMHSTKLKIIMNKIKPPLISEWQ